MQAGLVGAKAEKERRARGSRDYIYSRTSPPPLSGPASSLSQAPRGAQDSNNNIQL